MATKTPVKASKPAAKKAPAKKAPDPVVELTPIDDGVSIVVGDSHAVIKINGTFDLDGALAVAKRVKHAAAELS